MYFFGKNSGMVCLRTCVMYLYMLPSDGCMYKSQWYDESKTCVFLNYIFVDLFVDGTVSTAHSTCKSCLQPSK